MKNIADGSVGAPFAAKSLNPFENLGLDGVLHKLATILGEQRRRPYRGSLE